MSTLIKIRRQLHSVENIKKITRAMEMVAASRLRRAQAKAETSRPYFLKLKEILSQFASITHDFTHPLMEKRNVKKIGFIVIAADRGLCGAYNQNIFSATEKFLKNYSTEDVKLILFGRKAIEYFSSKKWNIETQISDWGGKITFHQIEEFTQHLIDQYLSGKLDEIWLIYTDYINIASRKVTIDKLLNIEFDPSSIKNHKKATSYIFEPSSQEILAEILPHYCITKVQSALSEAYASELGARIFSMRAAAKNAEEMIEKLTLTRNKLRQSNITRELLEITACVENLK